MYILTSGHSVCTQSGRLDLPLKLRFLPLALPGPLLPAAIGQQWSIHPHNKPTHPRTKLGLFLPPSAGGWVEAV